MFGANGSGKSNIIEAFALFTSIIARGLANHPYKPNRLAITKPESTSFELGFFTGESTYQYCLAYDQDEIVAERLVANGTEVFSYTGSEHSFTTIATSVYTPAKLKEIFAVEANHQQTFLAVLATGFTGLSREMTAAFSYITNHIAILIEDQGSVGKNYVNHQYMANSPSDYSYA